MIYQKAASISSFAYYEITFVLVIINIVKM